MLLYFQFFFVAYSASLPFSGAICDGSQPLGVSTGFIGDGAITASSTYPASWDPACDTQHARLLRSPPGAAWCPSQKSASEWLQIDLGFPSKITSVATQGRTDGREWVSAFHLSHSVDGRRWEYVRDLENGDIRAFAGNAESHSVKHNYLERSITARFVKFHPVRWHGHPSMRVELYGCQKCASLISVQPWAQPRASSQWLGRDGNRCRIDNVFLYSSGAWCPKKRDLAPWIEYDFGPPALVTAVATRGKEPPTLFNANQPSRSSLDRPLFPAVPLLQLTENGISSSERLRGRRRKNRFGKKNRKRQRSFSRTSLRPQWVTTYKVMFRNSSDGVWSTYSDENIGNVFAGNADSSSIKTHYLLKPFVARFVRFIPLKWIGYPSMRVAIYGCADLNVVNQAEPTQPTVNPSQSCPAMFLKPAAETPCVENLAFKKKAWAYMKRHHKRHLPAVASIDAIAEKAVDGNISSSQHTCMPLNNAQVSDPTWMVDIGRRSQLSGVMLWLWHPSDGATRASVEQGLRWLDKIVVFVTNHPVSRAASLANYEGRHLCATVKNFDNRFARQAKPVHFICKNPLVGRFIYVVAIGVTGSSSARSSNSANKFHTSICEVMAYS